MHSETVRVLIRENVLESIRLPSSRTGISRHAMESYKAKYVTTTELATGLGTSPRWIREVLQSAGIRPALSRSTSSVRVSVYLRADVPPNLADLYAARFRKAPALSPS